MEKSNKIRAKYLGKYILGYVLDEDTEELIEAFINEDEGREWDNFRTDEILRMDGDSLWDGWVSETNTSAIVMKFTNYGETAKFYRIY